MAYRETARVREKKEQTRAGILRAVAKLIAANEPVAMDAVAAGAGVSVGSLYTYFANRRDLLRALFEERAGIELSVMQKALAEPGHPAVVLADAVRLALQRMRRNPHMSLFLLHERMERDSQMEALKLAFHRRHCLAFAALIGRGMEEGLAPRQNAEVTASVILGSLIETALRAFTDPTDPIAGLTPEELEQELARAVVFACGFRDNLLPEV